MITVYFNRNLNFAKQLGKFRQNFNFLKRNESICIITTTKVEIPKKCCFIVLGLITNKKYRFSLCIVAGPYQIVFGNNLVNVLCQEKKRVPFVYRSDFFHLPQTCY